MTTDRTASLFGVSGEPVASGLILKTKPFMQLINFFTRINRVLGNIVNI